MIRMNDRHFWQQNTVEMWETTKEVKDKYYLEWTLFAKALVLFSLD